MFERNYADDKMIEMLRTAYGYSEEQLLTEFEAAERQLKEHPELLEELKAPVGEFEKIMKRVREKRGA